MSLSDESYAHVVRSTAGCESTSAVDQRTVESCVFWDQQSDTGTQERDKVEIRVCDLTDPGVAVVAYRVRVSIMKDGSHCRFHHGCIKG